MSNLNTMIVYFKGRLEQHSYGDADDVLFIVDETRNKINLLEAIVDAIREYGNRVNVRYWISNKPIKDVDYATEAFLTQLFISSKIEAEFTMVYSEVTGYLWTDESFTVGGHDVLEELRTYLGSWLLLEIEFIKR